MSDIFVSYAREDDARIRPLVSALEQRGWSVFWDHRIPAGETWRSHIGGALDQARCVVVAWTTSSVASEFVVEEAARARRRGVLVPVRLEEVEPPLGFAEVNAADLSAWDPGTESALFEQLAADLAVVIARTPGASAAPKSTRDRGPDTPPERTAETRRERPGRAWMLASLAVAAIAIAIAVAVVVVSRSSTPPGPPAEVASTSSAPHRVAPLAPSRSKAAAAAPGVADDRPAKRPTDLDGGVVISHPSLTVEAGADPSTVRPGQRAIIHVNVRSSDTSAPVEGADVTVSAGGGRFLAAHEPFELNARLHGPFSTSGTTDASGSYVTAWACRPCTAQYTISVRAERAGFVGAFLELPVRIH